MISKVISFSNLQHLVTYAVGNQYSANIGNNLDKYLCIGAVLAKYITPLFRSLNLTNI